MAERARETLAPAQKSYWEKLKIEFQIDRHLVPIKIVIFLFNGGMLAFLPFLTLHMQQLGITVQEIAVMYALLPCCALIGPPVMGLIADRLGRYILILNITIFCGGLFHTLLLLVPPAPLEPALMRCTPAGYEIVRGNCDSCLLQSNMSNVQLTMKNCYYSCDGVRRPLSGLDGVLCFQNANVSHCIQLPYTDTLNMNGVIFLHEPRVYHCSFVLKSSSVMLGNITQENLGYDLYDNIACPLNTESAAFRGSMTTDEYIRLDTVPGEQQTDDLILNELQEAEDQDQKKEEDSAALKLLAESSTNKTTTPMTTESTTTEDTTAMTDVTTTEETTTMTDVTTMETTTTSSMPVTVLSNAWVQLDIVPMEQQTDDFTLNELQEAEGQYQKKKENSAAINLLSKPLRSKTATPMTTQSTITEDTATMTDVTTTVTTSPSTDRVHDSFPFSTNNYDVFWAKETSSYVKNKCRLHCRVRGTPSCAVKEGGSRYRTLIIYFVFRGLGSFSIASSYTMMDATTLTLMRQYKGDYGKQRAVNMVAFAIVPAFAGLLMDYQSSASKMDFSPLFIVSDILFLLSIIGISNMEIKVVIPSNKIMDNIRELLSLGEINVFLVLICILGLNFGFIESYMFVYLKSMKATGFLLGLTITVGAGVSFPILIWADKIVQKLGRHVIFITSFLVYTVRMIGYSFITNPWMSLPFEALEIFTCQLMWVATATYCSVMAPPGLLATTTGLIGCMHYSIGRGLGAFLGGYIISKLTIRRAFRVFGMIALGGAVLYTVVHYCYLRHKIRKREEETLRLEALNKSAPVTDCFSQALLNNVAAMTSSRASFAIINTVTPIRRIQKQDFPISSDDSSSDNDREDDYTDHYRVHFTCHSIQSTNSMPTPLTRVRSLFGDKSRSSPSYYNRRTSEPIAFTPTGSGHMKVLTADEEEYALKIVPSKLADISDDNLNSTEEQDPPSPTKLSEIIYSQATSLLLAEEITIPLHKPAKEGVPDLSTITE